MIMSLKQRKISKIKTKDKIEPQHIHLLEKQLHLRWTDQVVSKIRDSSQLKHSSLSTLTKIMPKEVFNSLYCRYFVEAFAGTRMPRGMGDAIFGLCKGVSLELVIIYGN